MILIGQYDSPFVRRVGIALTLYEMPFEHRPWSSFGDADKLRALNPLTRVPTLVLDDGTVLTDSHLILDYLDGMVAPEKALAPRREPMRHQHLRIVGLATGTADKAVSMFYEKALHKEVSPVWLNRCAAQVNGALAVLEQVYAGLAGTGFVSGNVGHADIATACMWRFLTEAHAGFVDVRHYPALNALSNRLEALPVFKAVCQPFIPPA